MRNLARKNIQIIAALGLFALALLSAFALLRFPAPVRADETQNIPTEGGNLAGGSYTLSADVTVEKTLQISGDVTIDLNGHALSLEEGQEGSVIQLMSGSLTLKSSSGQGEIKGGNSTTGGGVFVAGTLTLSGNVKITENKGSNIYLSNNNKIVLDNFTGNVGISMGTPGAFTDGEVTNGTFTSDDKGYSVVGKELKIAKLQSITANYTNTGKVFPTTELEDLKSNVTVTGTNENNAPYIGQIKYTLAVVVPGAPADPPETDEADETPETPKTETKNELSLGKNTILVTATGAEEETATATFEVEAVKPELTSIQAEYQAEENVYFDTALETLISGLTVKGSFEDGVDRPLSHESVKDPYLEAYIDEYYALSGDLGTHPDGVSTVTVSCKGKTASVSVPVSKYAIAAETIGTADVVVTEKAGTLAASAFAPKLPAGIEAVATYRGSPIDLGKLGPGVYEITLSFTVLDPDNYDPITGTRTAKLTVNRAVYAQSGEDGETICSFEKDGGIDPEWEIDFRDASTADLRAEGDYEVMQACEITVRKAGNVVTDPGELKATLLLSEKVRKKTDLKLYRVLADGTLYEVSFTREGNEISFEASDFAYTRYAIAANSDFGSYVVMTLCFGGVCIVGAGVLLWYFIVKRKMKIKG